MVRDLLTRLTCAGVVFSALTMGIPRGWDEAAIRAGLEEAGVGKSGQCAISVTIVRYPGVQSQS